MEKILMKKVGEFKGQDINEYTLSNEYMDVKILDFGGIIREINVANKEGKKENVVLAYNSIEDYITNPSYYGSTIGRTSGRIADGKITVDGTSYQLNKNYVVSNCHGGDEGFNKKFWNVDVIDGAEESSLVLTYTSVDGEENYPATLDVKVTFSLNNKNEFSIGYEAIADKDTIVNMTNHSYFNLSGDYKHGVELEDLYVSSDSILEIDDNSVPTGKIIKTEGSAFDFNVMKNIGKDIDADDAQIKIGAGYDHPFNLSDEKTMILEDKISGRGMMVTTDNNCVVIYSMNYPDGVLGLGEKELKRRYGICFECQNKPVGANEAFLEESLLKAGDTYNRTTTFKFYDI